MKPQKILVVDDEPMILSLEIGYCKHLFPGAIILSAENGVVALDLVREEKPGLIISDLNMPEMNGIELLKMVKADFPEIEFVLGSGDMTENLATIASSLGARATLKKPFTFSEFQNALGR